MPSRGTPWLSLCCRVHSNWLRFVFITTVTLLSTMQGASSAGVACSHVGTSEAANAYCADQAPGSTCNADGFCTNPYRNGCLKPEHFQEFESDLSSRVCSSMDGDNVEHCSANKLNFQEVRLLPGNWESSMFTTWIAQIFLSEILRVPTTIEVGSADKNLDFYHPENTFGYPTLAYDWEALKAASSAEDGQCNNIAIGNEYQSCAHAMLEVWPSGNVVPINDLIANGDAEDAGSPGTYGNIGWYTFERVIREDPSLKSFYTYRDASKMANYFKRPVTWYEYCISPGYGAPCDSNNQVARAPPTVDTSKTPPTSAADVGSIFFHESKYRGYFVADNCTSDPGECGGYLIQAPCEWSTFSDAQIRWSHPSGKLRLKIDGPLSTGGYGYSHMRQILKAAGTNGENVLMWWWSPEADLTKWKLNSTWKLTQVLLPDYTEDCNVLRPSMEEKCSMESSMRWGSKNVMNKTGREGPGCSNPTELLKKILSTGLQKQTRKVSVVATPALKFLQRFQIEQSDVDDILFRWRYGHTDGEAGSNSLWARQTVCNLARNLTSRIRKDLPIGFPKILEDRTGKPGEFLILQIVAGILLVGCLVLLVLVHAKRNDVKIRRSQPLFLKFILVGAALLYLYCILRLELASSEAVCHFNIWLLHIGWAVFFLPLLLKTYRLLQIFTAAKRLRRKTVSVKTLLALLTAWIVCVEVVICALWSGILSPKPESIYMTELNSPNVLIEYKVCETSISFASSTTAILPETSESLAGPVYEASSTSRRIFYLPVLLTSSILNGMLVLIGVILAIRTRNISKKFSESSQQAAIMYNSGVFTALAFILFLTPSASPHSSALAQVSCMVTCLGLNLVILFVPKFFDLSDVEMSKMDKNMGYVADSRNARKSSLTEAKQGDKKRKHEKSEQISKGEDGVVSILSLSSHAEHNKSIEFTTYANASSSEALSKEVVSDVYMTAQREDL